MIRSHPPSGDEARDVLADVLRDQQERAQRRDQASPEPRRSGPVQTGLALALAGLTIWVWIAPPTLVRPPPPPPLSAPVAEAELRLTVYQVVMTVEDFAGRIGVLPRDLGDPVSDLLGDARRALGAGR